ncbi:MAG: hypothetical protein IPK14_28310 [Blastocatellia bacterium]|nr:hypothetical protein [Blastocatellia bacterium]
MPTNQRNLPPDFTLTVGQSGAWIEILPNGTTAIIGISFNGQTARGNNLHY